MKKQLHFLLALGILGLSGLSQALPTLDEGDSYLYHKVSLNETFNPSPQPSSDVDWQFHFDSDSSVFLVQVSPAINHPEHDNFPSADLVWRVFEP